MGTAWSEAKGSAIIIGGGIAGLAAARELTRKGLHVTLLEAAERFGGRIHTIRHGSLPVELGAEFIHGKSKPLLGAIKAARLAFGAASMTVHLAENGNLKPVNFWPKVEEIIVRIDPHGPDRSFAAFLEGEDIAARERSWARAFAEGFNAADAEWISAQSILKAQKSAARMEGDWQGRVRRGYGALVAFLEKDVKAKGGRLLSGTAAQRIRWARGQVEVAWQSAADTGICRAAAALITLPLGVWQASTVTFHPPLREKRAAAHELVSGSVKKISLVFRERWWPDAGNQFIQSPHEHVPTWWGNPRGPLLTGWAGGPKATALLPLAGKQVERVCLEVLARIFDEKASRLKRQLVASYSYNWTDDPNFRGAYSYIPVNGLELPKVLAEPVAGTLFFAGEATTPDAQMGTVFGAYESGLRAAREVLNR
jgi:monoamine oxidase